MIIKTNRSTVINDERYNTVVVGSGGEQSTVPNSACRYMTNHD